MTGIIKNLISFSSPLSPFPRAELTQSSSNASGGQGQGLSSDESSSPPSSVPQTLDFSPEKSDFPLSQGSSTGAAQGEAEPCKDTHPTEVRGGGCSYMPSELHGESQTGTHSFFPSCFTFAGANGSSRLRAGLRIMD